MTNRRRWAAGVALFLLVNPTSRQPLEAQRIPPAPALEAGTGRLVLAGVAGWAGGWLVGGAAGIGLAKWNPLDGDDLDDGSWTPGILVGLQSGQAVSIPLAVHRANGHKGSLSASVLASSAVSLVAVAAMWTDDLDGLFEAPGNAAAWLAIPVVQIGTSILVERLTGG